MTTEIKINRVINIVPFVALILSFLLHYSFALKNLFIKWKNEDFSYCFLVPLIFLYLLIRNRDKYVKLEMKSSGFGIMLIVIAEFFFIGGDFGSIDTLTFFSIWISIIGVGLLIFGLDHLKNTVFPLFVLLFIIPIPPFFIRMLTFKLKLLSSAVATWMLTATGIPVFREGNIIDISVTKLQVVDACSGLRYILPLFLISLIFSYIAHKKWIERGLIILSIIPLAIFLNSLRIFITGYLAIRISKGISEGFFHGFSGWLLFMMTTVFLFLVSGLLKRFTKS